MPLTNHGKLTGVLYLENSLSAGAFTHQKTEVLKILSSEISISIENARLYYNLNNINKAYERFVPKQFLSFLNKDSITELNLGDQVQKEMAILFADIKDFTSLSEQYTPEANFNFINTYLGEMDPVISRHHGFIDKYIGDAIMALFPTGAQDALDSALALLQTLETFNKKRIAAAEPPISIGIGINTGSLMLGIIGGENRWDGTVISDAVNLASRIEGLTREYDTQLLISEFTFAQLTKPDQHLIREIDYVRVKGKSVAVTVYEVFDADAPATRRLKTETLQTFNQALSHYRLNEPGQALRLFEEILEKNPDDQVVKRYIKRCRMP